MGRVVTRALFEQLTGVSSVPLQVLIIVDTVGRQYQPARVFPDSAAMATRNLERRLCCLRFTPMLPASRNWSALAYSTSENRPAQVVSNRAAIRSVESAPKCRPVSSSSPELR